MKYRQHRLDVYDVQILHASTRTQWRTLDRKELDGHGGDVRNVLGRTTEGTRDWRQVIAIYTRTKGQDEAEAMRTCVHEAVHAAGFILDRIGQKDHDRGSEAMAYLTEWIAAWLWEGVARHY